VVKSTAFGKKKTEEVETEEVEEILSETSDDMLLLFNSLRDTYGDVDSRDYSEKQRVLINRVNGCVADLSDIIYDELGIDKNEDSHILVEDLEDHIEDTADLIVGYILQRT